MSLNLAFHHCPTAADLENSLQTADVLIDRETLTAATSALATLVQQEFEDDISEHVISAVCPLAV